MSFTSSPRTYSRRSLNSMPRPTWIAAYSPSSNPRTLRCAWIERRALTRARWATVSFSSRPRSRCRYRAEHRVDDALGLHPVGQRLEAEVDPMTEHGVPQLPDVLRDDVVAALDDGHRASGLEEGDAAARAGADLDVGAELGSEQLSDVPGRPHEADDVAADRRVDIDPPDHRLHVD